MLASKKSKELADFIPIFSDEGPVRERKGKSVPLLTGYRSALPQFFSRIEKIDTIGEPRLPGEEPPSQTTVDKAKVLSLGPYMNRLRTNPEVAEFAAPEESDACMAPPPAERINISSSYGGRWIGDLLEFRLR